MANEYFDHTTYPSTGASGTSSAMRSELDNIELGFDKLPTMAANGGKLIAVNAGATALESITTTGTGSGVRATSPTLVTPILGTPTSGTLTNCTGLPVASGISGLGTSVATALAVNVGTAGGVVVNGGVLGTPSSGTLTSCTGLPVATGISGLGTGVATLLATPSSANLAAAITDETGSGALVFATSPTLVTPALGTPASGDLRNCSLAVAPAIGGTTPNTGAFTTLTATGTAAIGTILATQHALRIFSSTSGNVAQMGINLQPTFNSDATTYGMGMLVAGGTAAAAFTMPNLYNIYISDATKGAGSTITTQYGLYIVDQTKGTNNYGINNQVSSGANKWGYYGSGTADNAFAGHVRVGGVTAPVAELDVTGAIAATTSILSSGATSGVGYTTGAGGTVAQGAGSGKATGVTLAKVCGTITMDGANLAADTTVTFLLTMTGFTLNTSDQLVLNHISVGTFGAYTLNARYASATTMNVDVHNNTPGALAEAIVIHYSLVRSVAA